MKTLNLIFAYFGSQELTFVMFFSFTGILVGLIMGLIIKVFNKKKKILPELIICGAVVGLIECIIMLYLLQIIYSRRILRITVTAKRKSALCIIKPKRFVARSFLTRGNGCFFVIGIIRSTSKILRSSAIFAPIPTKSRRVRKRK